MDKVIVTGGLGYIGSHTCVSLCENGYLPVIVDNLSNSKMIILERIKKITGRDIPFYQLDCRNKGDLDIVFNNEQNIKSVIHFAAFKSVNESIDQPILYYENNISSLLNIIKCIDENGIDSLIFSSSCTVYGEPDVLPIKESSDLKTPITPYGFSKYVGERIINDWILSSIKNSSVLLRYFNPVGAHSSHLIGELPNGKPNNLVPFVTQSAIGKIGDIIINGNDYDTPDGTCIRDYIHVCDLAYAHVKSIDFSLKNKGTNIFNIGTGKGTSVKEIIDKFQSINSVRLSYKYGPRRNGDIEKIWANCDRAEKILKWKSSISIDQALFDAWEWEKNLSNVN